MEEKIVLDKNVFKALSVTSRINILKLLNVRNHTLSELSSDLNLSNSTVKEHVDVLVSAGLIKKIDDGHKWKYYKLTFKGKNFISPKEVKVLFAFVIALFAFIGLSFYFLQNIFSKTTVQLDSVAKVANANMAPRLMNESNVQVAQFVNTPFFSRNTILLIGFILIIFILGLTTGYLIKKKILILGDKK